MQLWAEVISSVCPIFLLSIFFSTANAISQNNQPVETYPTPLVRVADPLIYPDDHRGTTNSIWLYGVYKQAWNAGGRFFVGWEAMGRVMEELWARCVDGQAVLGLGLVVSERLMEKLGYAVPLGGR